MSQSRFSSHANKTHQPAEVKRFIGISLSGGKSDKACLAVVEYFPQHQKLFLVKIHEKIKSEENISADSKIHEIIEQYKDSLSNLVFDVPFRLPACLECRLVCPGYEQCQEAHILWQWKKTKQLQKKKKPKKLFTPYTQRCVDLYMANFLEEKLTVHHPLGANLAPLVARAAFIRRRLSYQVFETNVHIAVWRIGRSLQVMKRHLRFFRHAVSGEESRKAILEALTENGVIFIYQQDSKLLAENAHAFEAFICAVVSYLQNKNAVEERPEDFPEKEDWMSVPKEKIVWFK